MSAKLALLDSQVRSVLVRECKAKINSIMERGLNMSISWAKGHAGHTGNEVADWLAGVMA